MSKGNSGLPSREELEQLTSSAEALFSYTHIVTGDFGLTDTKDHRGILIDYQDVTELRMEFIKELSAKLTTFVYSPEKQDELVTQLSKGRDLSSAYNMLRQKAVDKFRISSLQGQFGEILLFVVIQHFFRAPPLLRKMKLTTNPALERNGADAIHIGYRNDELCLFIGEAKTLWRQDNAGREAILHALSDVVEHCKNNTKELLLYASEDFLPSNLQQVANDYICGNLKDTKLIPVCLCSYEAAQAEGNSRKELLKDKEAKLQALCSKVAKNKRLTQTPQPYLGRVVFILFPAHELKKLVNEYAKFAGIKTDDDQRQKH